MVKEKPRLTFYPFAYALLTEEICQYCWYCLNPVSEKKRCLGCGLALFCNKECQLLGWKDHKAECAGFKKNILPDIETRILGRIVLRHKDIVRGKDKKDPNFYKDRTSKRSIMEIWAHTDKIKQDQYAMKKFGEVYENLIAFYEEKYLLDKNTVFELHCRDYINRHAISDKSYMREIGKGLYLDLCAYDHSCRPNTIYSCIGFIATLRGLSADMDITNKKTTFYSYIELLCSYQERQKLLRDTWYFKCQCERCTDRNDHWLTSVYCPNCPPRTSRLQIFGEPDYMDKLTSIIECPECKEKVAKEYVIEAISSMRFVDKLITDKELEQMPLTTRKSFLEDLLNRYERILPPINVYLCKIIQNLIPLISASDHKELLRLHLLSEECVRFSFPHNHPAVAFHLRNIGIFYQGLEKLEEAQKYFKEAQEILEFTLDSDHPMTQENLEMLEGVKKLRGNQSPKKTENDVVEQKINDSSLTQEKSNAKSVETKEDQTQETSCPRTNAEGSESAEHTPTNILCASDLFSDDMDDLPELIQ